MPDVIKVAEATAGRKSRQFMLVDSSGNALTGATVTGRLLKDGAEGAAAGTFAEVSAANRPGLYTYTPSTTEMASAGACLLRPIATGAIAAEWPFQIIGNDVYAASATAPTNFSAMSITSGGAVTAGTVSDKTGYTLGASQTFSTTGSVDSVTGSVASVTALGTQAKADVTAAVPTAAQNAAAVRDVFGLASSVADTAPTASSFIGAAGLSAEDDFYQGMFLVFDGGTLDGVGQKVKGYVGATRTFTVAPAFPATPANGDPFLLIGRG